MRRAAILFAVLAIVMIPAAALATPPEVVDQGDFALDHEPIDWATEECGFPVYLTIESSYTITMFSDKDGEPIRQRWHEVGKVEWTSDYGETWENWAAIETIDFVKGTTTYTGNVWNLHAGAGGILVNDSGRIVFGGSEVIANGPHQGFLGEFDGLCNALAPS